MDPVSLEDARFGWALNFHAGGLQEEAIAALEEYSSNPWKRTFRFVAAHPVVDSIREHPRYVELRARYASPA